jgi:DNA-binding IclR family transcriptional regulator
LLAFLSDEACDDLLGRLPLRRNTRRTIVKPAAMKVELVRIRAQGYAVDDEEFEEGLRCVSAPVFDHRGHVVASLSMAAPVFRLRKESVPQVARLVVAPRRGSPTTSVTAIRMKRSAARRREGLTREGPPFHIVKIAVPR